MANDFDFDGPVDDDPDNEIVEEEAVPAGRSRGLLRILLLLILLVLLCVACYFGSSRFGISIPGLPGQQPAPQPAPTDVGQVPATDEVPGGGEVPPTEEAPGGGEVPATDEAPGDGGEVPATDEAPGDGDEVPATDEAPGDDGTAPTSEPVPGPTSTPGPTVVVTISPDCSDNTLPMADANGPYSSMMGKGTAFIVLDGSGSSDDGNIVEYAWDFGDGTDPEISEEASVTHGYSAEGSYIVTLTVMDDCGATAVTTTEVTIVGPTPPANGTVTVTPVMTTTPVVTVTVTATPTAPSQPAQVTPGFCYLVQQGNTLTGIAYYYGVSLYDLATVNNVTTEYYVKYGQGLFIPTGPVRPGPNAYTAEAGDTLYSIAYQCGVTAYQVAQANNLDINASLSPGQVITIPIGYR